MYSFVLAAHNIVRWVVLLTGVIALLNSYRGLLTGAAWTPRDRTIAAAYANTFGLQFLLGLLLYVWLSPVTRRVLATWARRCEIRRFACS